MDPTLKPTPMAPFIQDYLARHSGDINRIARSLGLPPTAIAGGVAEEMSTVYPEAYMPDSIGGGTWVAPKNTKDWIQDGYVLPHSHQDIANDFAAREPAIRNGDKPGFKEKLQNPTANDIGPGNVNLGQAILLLKRYLADPANAGDPLDLKKYAGDYHRLAQDLVDLDSPATFAVAGLLARQGYDNLAKIYGPAFTNGNESDQTALLTSYYKRGVQSILIGPDENHPNHPNFVANPDGSVSPKPGSPAGFDPLPDLKKSDGGPFIFRNFDEIKDAVSGKHSANQPQGDSADGTQQEDRDDSAAPANLRPVLEQHARDLGIEYVDYLPTSALLAAIHTREADEAQPHELDDMADRIEQEMDRIGLNLLQYPESDAPPPQGLAPLTRAGIGARADRLGIPYAAASPGDQLLAQIHANEAEAAPSAAAPALADHIERDIDQVGALAHLPGFSEVQDDA